MNDEDALQDVADDLATKLISRQQGAEDLSDDQAFELIVAVISDPELFGASA